MTSRPDPAVRPGLTAASAASVASALADAAALGGYFAIGYGTASPAAPRPDGSPPADREPADADPAAADPAAADPAAADPADVEPAAADPAAVDPADVEPADEEPAGWVPAVVAYQLGMAELAAQTGHALGTGEHRVAVSTLQLGYAARLWSPALACALASGTVPDLARLEVSGGLPLRVRLPSVAGWRLPDIDTAAGWRAPDTDTAAGLLYDVVVTGHLAALAAGLRGQVASGLLWGNAASAMMGSLRVLVRARPGLAGPARSVAARLLVTGTLRGTGRLTGPGLGFRRNSCCLYYRVPGGGLCGDCSLDDAGH